MRSALFILPFLSLLFGALGTTLASSFAANALVYKSVGWGIAAILIAIWVWRDLANFKSLFARKGAKYGASSGVVVLLGVLVIVGIAVITNKPRFNKTMDLSKDKTNTLSDQSIKMIDNLNKKPEEAKVTAFFMDAQQEQQFKDQIGLYLNRGAKLNVEYVNPQKDPTRAMSEKLTSGNTVVFRLGNQENRVTTFTEEKITNALVSVLKEGSKKLYFTKGHGEGQLGGNEASGFDVLSQELKNNRYEVADLSLLDSGKVPDDATALVIAGPKYDFKEEEGRFLSDFIHRGGAVLVMVDAMVHVDVLNKTLSTFGISFNNDFIILRPDDPRAQLLGQNNAIVSDFDEFSPVTKDFAKKSNVAVLLQNTRTITEKTDNDSKFKISLIGKTSAETGVKLKNVNGPQDLKNITQDRIEQGSFAVMATATGKVGAQATAKADTDKSKARSDVASDSGTPKDKEARLIAVGSVQFATNQGAQQAEHRDMFLNMVSYLTQDDDFIAIRPKDATKSTLSLASGGSTLNLLFISFIYPFVFLGLGTIFWLRRKQA